MACLQPLLLSPNSGAASQKGQIGSRLSCNVDQKNPFRVCLVIRIVVFTKLNQTKPCYSEAISLLSDFGVLKPWYSCSKQSRLWQAAENQMDCLNSPGKQPTTLTMQLLQWTVNLVSILSVCQVFIVKIALGIRAVFLFVVFLIGSCTCYIQHACFLQPSTQIGGDRMDDFILLHILFNFQPVHEAYGFQHLSWGFSCCLNSCGSPK